MIRRSDFSLRTFSVASSVWYVSVVVGWSLMILAGYEVATASVSRFGPALAMTAVLLLVLELLPLVQGRGHDPQGVVMSTAFVCAMLLIWGVWPAIVMVAIAAIAADLRVGKQWWKVLFNAGQYTVSVASGYLVMLLVGVTPSLEHPLGTFRLGDLSWVCVVWVVYFAVNLGLVAGVLSSGGSFRSALVDDFANYTAMTFAVLALSPLVVVMAQHAWAFLPLLLIPLVLLYNTAQMSLSREHEATHDALTGLSNRTALQFALLDAFNSYARDGKPFGLFVIDLDDFKRVNDSLGHQIGDHLLVRVAERLRMSVRPTDHVARLGGDEFAVIVLDAHESEVRAIAGRIRESLVEPIELRGLMLDVELSIGIAICPDHGTDGDTLLRHADVAMYVAKESRAGIETYSAECDRNSIDQLGLLGELRQALDDHALELHYQPKQSTRDCSTLGVEALVRWRHPQRGFVPPDEFIPLAERSGIMPLLTERVVTLALDQMARWRELGMTVPVAVNVSPTDLVGHRLTDLIASGLRHRGLPAELLQLEITERIVAGDAEETNAVLSRLRALGVSISLDDFGTGYSSLVRLQSLPVDELKIDRIFVSAMARSPEAAGIVRAVIDLAHVLGLPAIAEGVETEEEWQLLYSLGCDGVQGWHVAKPMPHDQATEWVRARGVAAHPYPRREAVASASEQRAM
ncbi:MAG: GGDEF-domain containing protein [Pseudonocardiales bacterium]|nr:GGDEF-domain containing protein [Pseudonocardiales bacterium]